jgi:hypothetical protein
LVAKSKENKLSQNVSFEIDVMSTGSITIAETGLSLTIES